MQPGMDHHRTPRRPSRLRTRPARRTTRTHAPIPSRTHPRHRPSPHPRLDHTRTPDHGGWHGIHRRHARPSHATTPCRVIVCGQIRGRSIPGWLRTPGGPETLEWLPVMLPGPSGDNGTSPRNPNALRGIPFYAEVIHNGVQTSYTRGSKRDPVVRQGYPTLLHGMRRGMDRAARELRCAMTILSEHSASLICED